jgi:hypothetical protein
MLIFFDTEFTSLHFAAKLISIGMIAEDGQTFYAELTDTYTKTDCHPWVKENVLSLLDADDEQRMTKDELTLKLGNWLESFEQPVILSCDSEDWDWPWIQYIFRAQGTWPINLAQKPDILKFNDEAFNEAVEGAFKLGLRQHHALDDAKANRLGWLALT